MKSGIHWQILIPFLLTPLLSLGLFVPVYFKVKNSSEIPENDLLIPLGIFGVLGLWLLLTAFLRAKIITTSTNQITIKRIFTLRKFQYHKSEIINHSISGHRGKYDDYSVLQFITKDGKTHAVVSYELRNFKEIVNWISKSHGKYKKIGNKSFILKCKLPLIRTIS